MIFFKMFHTIPLILPLTTIFCPPSQNYINQFSKNENTFGNDNNLNHQMNSSRNLKELNAYNSDGINDNNLDNDFDEGVLKKLRGGTK